MKKQLEIGKIINTHGVKGELKIEPWTDDAEFLERFTTFIIDEKPYKLLGGRVHRGCLIARLEGVEDINTAMSLKNRVIFGYRDDIKLEDGKFFLKDILGATVVHENGTVLGELSEVLDLPAGYVYLVRGEREILIPDVPEFIIKKDLNAGIITVHLIDGM